MKRFMPVVIATVACAVLAGEKVLAAEQPQPSKTETYSYGTKLDIAKVVSVESPANVCQPTPVHMVYEDHQGQRHTLEYRVMGTGCQTH